MSPRQRLWYWRRRKSVAEATPEDQGGVRAMYRRLAAEYEKEPVTTKRGCGAPGDPYPL